MSSIAFDILNNLKTAKTLKYTAASVLSPKSAAGNAEYSKGNQLERPTQSVTGATLRKYKGGVYYFMPVVFEHKGKRWEFDDAVVSVKGKKTIIETPLAGRHGNVKELISTSDYEISLLAVVSADDYPEQEAQEIVRLWEINEAIKMSCAITDFFLKEDDSVVIKDFDLPAMEGNEDMQAVTMKLVSDSPFDLEL